jgi:hypothetical protein
MHDAQRKLHAGMMFFLCLPAGGAPEAGVAVGLGQQGERSPGARPGSAFLFPGQVRAGGQAPGSSQTLSQH